MRGEGGDRKGRWELPKVTSAQDEGPRVQDRLSWQRSEERENCVGGKEEGSRRGEGG